jgi:hypothetical protein
MRLAVRDFGTALGPATTSVNTADDASKFDASIAGATFSFWIKFTKSGAGNIIAIFQSPQSGSDALRLNFESSGKLFMWNVGIDGTGTLGCKTDALMPLRTWIHVACTYEIGVGNKIYVNGALAASGTGKLVRPTDSFKAYPGSNGGHHMDDVRCWMKPLTAQEVSDLYYSSINSSVPTIWWEFDEGSGTTAIDSSGNGNDGTITGAAYTTDVPMKARTVVPESGDPRLMRRAVGGSLVLNGDFEYAPEFTAATTNNNRVIDGTASGGDASVGSAVMQEYKWKVNMYNTTSPSAQYDTSTVYKGTASMKLSGTQIKERVNITLGSRVYGDLNDPADIRTNLIPVLPNKSYTFSIATKLQASNIVGTPTGVYVNILEHTASAFKAHNRVFSGPGNGTGAFTYDWTPTTYVFTTTADTRYVNIYCALGGDSSNYFDGTAWFDAIDLRPTLPVTRALAGNRTLA